MKNYADRGGCYSPKPKNEADNTFRDLHNYLHHTKAEFNNCFIIYSKYFQNFKKDKIDFVELCNKFQSSQHAIIFAASFNSTMRNLKLNEISIFVSFCVFLLSLSFNFYLVQYLQSAMFACSGSAVSKPLLRDVNRPIIFLLLRQSSNIFFCYWTIGVNRPIIQKFSKFGRCKLSSRN